MTLALADFVAESNRIEGIHRPPRKDEIKAHEHFLGGDLTVDAVEGLVAVCAGRPLRRRPGMNVMVASHVPPPGGPFIEPALADILGMILMEQLTPYQAHQRYEHLHPFMDGNGRSGRAIWAWHMRYAGQDPFALPFLHRWYYQSLSAGRYTVHELGEEVPR